MTTVIDRGNSPCLWITYGTRNGKLKTVYHPKDEREWEEAKREIDNLPPRSKKIENRILMDPSAYKSCKEKIEKSKIRAEREGKDE